MFKIYFWKRKSSIKGSDKVFFELHSSAMEREKDEIRFFKDAFAAQKIKFKHALSQNDLITRQYSLY